MLDVGLAYRKRRIVKAFSLDNDYNVNLFAVVLLGCCSGTLKLKMELDMIVNSNQITFAYTIYKFSFHG